MVNKTNYMPHLMRFYVNDEVRVQEDKIRSLYYSNPIYLKDPDEEDYLEKPEIFLKKSQGKVIECDWDSRKNLWSHFVELSDKKGEKIIRLWFLETELVLS